MDRFRDQTIGFFGGPASQPSTWPAGIVQTHSGEEFGNDTTFLWRHKSGEEHVIAPEPSRSIIEQIERSLEAD
jgi:hypothetical protein